jgi:hypothetical protein
MGELVQQPKMSFDVETVLSQLTQNDKIALLSGKAAITMARICRGITAS